MSKIVVSLMMVLASVVNSTTALAAVSPTPEEQLVERTYAAVLDRGPDPGGLAYWSDMLESRDPVYVIVAIMDSPEFRNYSPSFETVYSNLFGRIIDESGAAYWPTIEYNVAVSQIIVSPEALTTWGHTNPDNFIQRMNRTRAGLGLPPMQIDQALVEEAEAYAQIMSDTQELEHDPNLPPGRGENIGYGPSVDSIYQALLGSPGHYDVITNPRVSTVGVGSVIDANGRVWTSHRFTFHRSVWDDLAQCESRGDWSINTGNGFYGGVQFTLSSWRAVGGTGYPHHATKAEQIKRAELLLSLQGWGAWPGCARKLGLR